MIGSIASAWVALRRRAILLTALLGTAGFALLSTVISFTSATQTGTGGSGPASGPDGAGVTLAQLSDAGGIVFGLENATTLTGVIAIGIAAAVFGGDFSSGTVRTLLVRQPNRLIFLAGKFLAVCGLLTAAAALATIVSVAASFALAGGQGVDTSAWSATEVLLGFVRVTGSMLGFAAMGGALGLLCRSPVAAIGIGVGWALALELIVTAAWSSAQDLLPASLLSSIADGTVTLAGAATLAVWLAVIAGSASWTFLRRDVRI